MKAWNYFFSMVMICLVTACTNKVYIQKNEAANLANYRSYMWVDTRADEHDNSPRATAYNDINLENAVNTELRKQGLKEVDHNPDMLLTYDVLVEKTAGERINPAYSTSFTRVFYNPFAKEWGAIYYPLQFSGYEAYAI